MRHIAVSACLALSILICAGCGGVDYSQTYFNQKDKQQTLELTVDGNVKGFFEGLRGSSGRGEYSLKTASGSEKGSFVFEKDAFRLTSDKGTEKVFSLFDDEENYLRDDQGQDWTRNYFGLVADFELKTE